MPAFRKIFITLGLFERLVRLSNLCSVGVIALSVITLDLRDWLFCNSIPSESLLVPLVFNRMSNLIFLVTVF